MASQQGKHSHKLTALERAVINDDSASTHVLAQYFKTRALQRAASWAILCKYHDIFAFLVDQITSKADRQVLILDAIWGCCGRFRLPPQVRETLQSALDKEHECNLSKLEAATTRADTFFIQLLIGKIGGVDAVDSLRRTPLHYAALACDVSCVRMLLERGASVNARDDKGRTPLLCTAVMLMKSKEGRELRKIITVDDKSIKHCVSLLVAHGADVNVQDTEGTTVMHMFAKAGSSMDCLKLLLQHGADATIRDLDDNTIVDLAPAKMKKDLQSLLNLPDIEETSNELTSCSNESVELLELRQLKSEVRMLREEVKLLRKESSRSNTAAADSSPDRCMLHALKTDSDEDISTDKSGHHDKQIKSCETSVDRDRPPVETSEAHTKRKRNISVGSKPERAAAKPDVDGVSRGHSDASLAPSDHTTAMGDVRDLDFDKWKIGKWESDVSVVGGVRAANVDNEAVNTNQHAASPAEAPPPNADPLAEVLHHAVGLEAEVENKSSIFFVVCIGVLALCAAIFVYFSFYEGICQPTRPPTACTFCAFCHGN